MSPNEPRPDPPPETAESLEERYIPGDELEPRKAGTPQPGRRRDLGLYSFGCALLVVGFAALGYAILQAVRAAL